MERLTGHRFGDSRRKVPGLRLRHVLRLPAHGGAALGRCIRNRAGRQGEAREKARARDSAAEGADRAGRSAGEGGEVAPESRPGRSNPPEIRADGQDTVPNSAAGAADVAAPAIAAPARGARPSVVRRRHAQVDATSGARSTGIALFLPECSSRPMPGLNASPIDARWRI